MSTTQQDLPKNKKKRTRRNYEKELRELEAYCKAHIEVLGERSGPDREDRYYEGKQIAFRQIIAKIETYGGNNGR